MKNRLHLLVICTVFLSACGSTDLMASAPPLSDESVISPVDFSRVTIKRFAEVDSGIFRGARPSLSQIQELADLKIKTVIDLQGGDATRDLVGWFMGEVERGEFESDIANEEKEVHELGIPDFLNAPLNSFNDVDPNEAATIERALQVMADPAQRPVFVHCGHGKDRTGLIAALYRVKFDGWTPQAAHEEMVKMGHHGHIDQFFTGALDRYFYRVTGWQPAQN